MPVIDSHKCQWYGHKCHLKKESYKRVLAIQQEKSKFSRVLAGAGPLKLFLFNTRQGLGLAFVAQPTITMVAQRSLNERAGNHFRRDERERAGDHGNRQRREAVAPLSTPARSGPRHSSRRRAHRPNQVSSLAQPTTITRYCDQDPVPYRRHCRDCNERSRTTSSRWTRGWQALLLPGESLPPEYNASAPSVVRGRVTAAPVPH